VSQIFISHSSINNAEAIAVHDWLVEQGWSDLFLDLHPERGIKAGQRWQEALKQGVERCELVILLISPAWTASKWCLQEFQLAKQMSKPLFGVIVEATNLADIPIEITGEWHLVDLTAGRRDYQRTVTLPRDAGLATVNYTSDGLYRLRIGLMQAGLDPKHFKWPPDLDADRAPFRGLRPLDIEDAGIFFGREGPTIVGLDMLRALREAAAPRLLVILGASGAGKSSFMRAGLLPRLAREDQHFLPLAVIRPERAVLTGETGLVACLDQALKAAGQSLPRSDICQTVEIGSTGVRRLLSALVDAKMKQLQVGGAEAQKPPYIVVPIDQAEELFASDAREEAQQFLTVLRGLVTDDTLGVIALFTIRSDRYEALQTAPALDGLRQQMLSLAPMPQGAFAHVIEGPAKRLAATHRSLVIDEPLVQSLLTDIEQGSVKDALPLLAFTLERLYLEFQSGGRLTLEHYRKLGGIEGSIEAAVLKALQAADTDPSIPRDKPKRLALLRRGLVPWLASVDPDTGAPRRRVARRSEIPKESLPLLDLLEQQRLLSSDVAVGTGEKTIEPAHDALLRQWEELDGWLKEDAGQLNVIDGVRRAAKTWHDNQSQATWLTHTGANLVAAERLRKRDDLAQFLGQTEWAYINACRSRVRRQTAGVGILIASIIAGFIGWYTENQWRPLADVAAYRLFNTTTNLTKGGASFRDCSFCPEVVVVPPGEFVMGSPESETERNSDEAPQTVTVPRSIAVSKFEITFAQWSACVDAGGCYHRPNDQGWGGGDRPVIDVSWDDITKQYLPWINRLTGQSYRLLTEAEWEYAARAGTTTRYSWGDEIGEGNANCESCKSQWDKKQTAPVGSFKPNAFGLYDMHGNVLEWVQDCYVEYSKAADGEVENSGQDSCARVMRGGSWYGHPRNLRAAIRNRVMPDFRYLYSGFRMARMLPQTTPETGKAADHILLPRNTSHMKGHSRVDAGSPPAARAPSIAPQAPPGFLTSDFRSNSGTQMPTCDGSPPPEPVPIGEQELANLALLNESITTGSSNIAGFSNRHNIRHLNDGWYNNCRSWIPAAMPAWVQIDLGDVYEIHKFRLGSEHSEFWKDRSPTEFVIKLRTDTTSDWVVAWHQRSDDVPITGTREFSILPQLARYVRIDTLATKDNDAVRLDEFEVYGKR